jgi:hypothetical protein
MTDNMACLLGHRDQYPFSVAVAGRRVVRRGAQPLLRGVA